MNNIGFDQQVDNEIENYSDELTDDKKFVCKTGQFKGFYVSSLVNCNLIPKMLQ